MTIENETPPLRGGQVEAWLKRQRDCHAAWGESWCAVDAMLDDLRDRADIGADWDHIIDDSNGQPTIIGVAGVDQSEIDTLVATLLPIVGPEDAYGVAIATVRAGWRPETERKE